MNPDTYGFGTNSLGNPAGDRHVESQSHLFWATALLAYTMDEFRTGLSTSTSRRGRAWRRTGFSAYRLGALLPLVSEFPLSLPGYYYQEISARQLCCSAGNYMIPLDKKNRWNVNINAATAGVDYLQGFKQPGDWLMGVGGGIMYQSSSVKIMAGYAYGIDAIAAVGRGNNSIGILMQFDLGHAKQIFSFRANSTAGADGVDVQAAFSASNRVAPVSLLLIQMVLVPATKSHALTR